MDLFQTKTIQIYEIDIRRKAPNGKENSTLKRRQLQFRIGNPFLFRTRNNLQLSRSVQFARQLTGQMTFVEFIRSRALISPRGTGP